MVDDRFIIKLLLFFSVRAQAITDYIDYIDFVGKGINKRIWDDLQYQIFLGDDDFVENIN